jgi:hypothetical protein
MLLLDPLRVCSVWRRKLKPAIRVNLESDSNVIDDSDSQLEKHDEQTSSTFRGITID